MFREILDIRHADSGGVIFAKVTQAGTELLFGQLDDQYWKVCKYNVPTVVQCIIAAF